MNIQNWLEAFKNNWIKHDVDGVLALFNPDVEYFETPFHKLSGIKELSDAWMSIHNQMNIDLKLDVYSSIGSKHAVKWALIYTLHGQTKSFAGTYLITLNDENKCEYFYHCCECKE